MVVTPGKKSKMTSSCCMKSVAKYEWEGWREVQWPSAKPRWPSDSIYSVCLCLFVFVCVCLYLFVFVCVCLSLFFLSSSLVTKSHWYLKTDNLWDLNDNPQWWHHNQHFSRIFHTMDSEDGIPTGYHLESHSASHWVIEELMLLANRCVATRLFNSAIKDFSVLRNHKPPENKKVPVEFTSLFKLVVPFKLDLVEMIKSLEEAEMPCRWDER